MEEVTTDVAMEAAAAAAAVVVVLVTYFVSAD